MHPVSKEVVGFIGMTIRNMQSCGNRTFIPRKGWSVKK